ncbi:hypothetical protein [Numidum massiliense]|uniref:hypothetical protein n=1 Tax=Numidum massiliense TaxID=1522315 RepID=UPI00164E00A9|nr:hypothetical protein [Numidum massiliense]
MNKRWPKNGARYLKRSGGLFLGGAGCRVRNLHTIHQLNHNTRRDRRAIVHTSTYGAEGRPFGYSTEVIAFNFGKAFFSAKNTGMA